jgi:hypothetical protein
MALLHDFVAHRRRFVLGGRSWILPWQDRRVEKRKFGLVRLVHPTVLLVVDLLNSLHLCARA